MTPEQRAPLDWQAIRYGDKPSAIAALAYWRERGWDVDNPNYTRTTIETRVYAFMSGYEAAHAALQAQVTALTADLAAIREQYGDPTADGTEIAEWMRLQDESEAAATARAESAESDLAARTAELEGCAAHNREWCERFNGANERVTTLAGRVEQAEARRQECEIELARVVDECLKERREAEAARDAAVAELQGLQPIAEFPFLLVHAPVPFTVSDGRFTSPQRMGWHLVNEQGFTVGVLCDRDFYDQMSIRWRANEVLARRTERAQEDRDAALAREQAAVAGWWRWCDAVKEFVEADVNQGLSNEALKAANDRADRLYRDWEQDRDNTALQALRRENLEDCLRLADVNSQATRRVREARRALDRALTDAAPAKCDHDVTCATCGTRFPPERETLHDPQAIRAAMEDTLP